MEQNVAAVLGVDSDRINIKATTEEKLGFTGRKEGISAQAVCLLEGLYEASVSMNTDSRCQGCSGCSK